MPCYSRLSSMDVGQLGFPSGLPLTASGVCKAPCHQSLCAVTICVAPYELHGGANILITTTGACILAILWGGSAEVQVCDAGPELSSVARVRDAESKVKTDFGTAVYFQKAPDPSKKAPLGQLADRR